MTYKMMIRMIMTMLSYLHHLGTPVLYCVTSHDFTISFFMKLGPQGFDFVHNLLHMTGEKVLQPFVDPERQLVALFNGRWVAPHHFSEVIETVRFGLRAAQLRKLLVGVDLKSHPSDFSLQLSLLWKAQFPNHAGAVR